jgi:hypothetical protein
VTTPTVTFDLELAVKNFETNLNKVENKLNTFHKDFKKDAKQSSKSWSSFIGNLGANAISAATSALIGLIGSMKDFGKEAFFAAVAAEETASKFSAVFSTMRDESDKTAKALQRDFGLGITESKELLSATGDLLTGFGFTQQAALKLANEVQELSVDLASFTNFSGGAKGASEAITKALLGERESIKALGVSIQEKAVKEQVALNISKGMIFETERQAKAQATLDLIVKQSGNAIGDYGRTSGGTANQLKLLGTRVDDLKIKLGSKLIPILSPLIVSMNEWIKANDALIDQKLTAFADNVSKAFRALADNAEHVGSAIVLASTYVSSFIITKAILAGWSKLTSILGGFRVALVALSGPIGVTITAIAALGGAIAFAINQGKDAESIKVLNQMAVATADLADLQKKLSEAQKMGSSSAITDAIQARIDAREAEIEKLKEHEIFKEEVSAAELERILKETNAKNEAYNKQVADKAAADKKLDALQKARDKAESARLDAIAKDNKKHEDFKTALFGKSQDSMTAWQKSSGKERADNLKSTFGTIATLSEHHNGALAAIGKAAAISTATIDGIAAVQKALAAAPPPFNFALAGVVGAATAINVSKIAGVKLEHGGIVPGSSFAGDSVQANLNSGEMVLNRGQQSQLFSVANGNGSGNSGDIIGALEALGDRISGLEIIVIADDTEIARSASRGVQSGVEIGRSR